VPPPLCAVVVGRVFFYLKVPHGCVRICIASQKWAAFVSGSEILPLELSMNESRERVGKVNEFQFSSWFGHSLKVGSFHNENAKKKN
jgi:hypothetical protein